MKTLVKARQVAQTGVAGALLLGLVAGSAAAGHGYAIKAHPLRGDFPTASGITESVAAAQQRAAAASLRSARRDLAVNPGDWLRGDFPRAGEIGSIKVTQGVDEVEVK